MDFLPFLTYLYPTLLRAARGPRLPLAALLLVAGALAARAQFAYLPTSVQNLTGTYTDLGAISSTNAADADLVMAFNFNLTAGTASPEYRVATTGTAGTPFPCCARGGPCPALYYLRDGGRGNHLPVRRKLR